jgi:integrase
MSLVAFTIKPGRIDEELLYRDPGGGVWLSAVCTLDEDSKGRMVVAQSIPKERRTAGEKGPARTKHEAFKVLVLALGAGLRRGEINRLLWRQVDLQAGVVGIEATEVGDLKTEDSVGDVAIDEALCGILQGFKARTTSQYVIGGMEEEVASSRTWGHAYRCTPVFNFLTECLRINGLDGNKTTTHPSQGGWGMIATTKGIYTASRFLRHADIQVTAMHCADRNHHRPVPTGSLAGPEFPGGSFLMSPDSFRADSRPGINNT